MRRIILAALLLLALLPISAAQAADPMLTVLEPADGATISGTSVTVKVKTGNFTIVPTTIALAEYGQRPDINRAGEGHIHLMLDLLPLVVSDKGDSYTFANVPPGEHQLKVELANNDHSSLYTPVLKTIRFRTVATPADKLPATAAPAPPGGPAPILDVLEPADGATISGTSVTVKVKTGNFTIVPTTIALAEYGQRPDINRAGEGHIHLMLDLLPLVVSDKGDSYTFANVPPGEHQLKVELANNDHSSLYTPVLKTIRFRTAAAPGRLPITAEPADRLPGWGLMLTLAFTLLIGGLVLRFSRQVAARTGALRVRGRQARAAAGRAVLQTGTPPDQAEP